MATHIPMSPTLALLSMILSPIKSTKKDILRHSLAAARMVIPSYWKTTTTPPLVEWANELDSIRDLERLLLQEMDRKEQFK